MQWQEVLKWWDEGAVAWQQQRREQEESWKRCEAQQRAAWDRAQHWQGPRVCVQELAQPQPQPQAQAQVQWQGQHAMPQQAQQARQAQQAQHQVALPCSPERPAQLPAHQAATLERQQSGSGAERPATKASSTGTKHTGSSGGVSEPPPAKRQPISSQWAWEVRHC